MTTASIVFEDAPDDNVNIKIVFGEGGLDDGSGAHRMAAQALTLLMQSNQVTKDLEIDEDYE